MCAQHIFSIGILRLTANSQYKNMYYLLHCYPISVSLQTQQGSWAPSLRQGNSQPLQIAKDRMMATESVAAHQLKCRNVCTLSLQHRATW